MARISRKDRLFFRFSMRSRKNRAAKRRTNSIIAVNDSAEELEFHDHKSVDPQKESVISEENEVEQTRNGDIYDFDNENSSTASVDDLGFRGRYGRLQKRRTYCPNTELTPVVLLKRIKSTELSQTILENTKPQQKPSEVAPETEKGRKRRLSSESEAEGNMQLLGCKLPLEVPCDNSFSSINDVKSPCFPECSNTSEFQVGDLLWSQVPGHPWWPCMVSIDPTSRLYVRDIKRKNSTVKTYHVQYFGNAAQRSWTGVGKVLNFEGRKSFYELPKKILQLTKHSRHDHILKTFKIAPSKMKEWELSVTDAEAALKMTPDERIRELTFEYTQPTGETVIPGVSESSCAEMHPMKSPHKTEVVKTDSENEDVLTDVLTVVDEKHDKVASVKNVNASKENGHSAHKKISNETDKKSKNRKAYGRQASRSSFKSYVGRFLKSVMDDDPEISSEEAENQLLCQWESFSENQKNYYAFNCPEETYDEPTPSSGKSMVRERKSKPVSAKVTDGGSEAKTKFIESSASRRNDDGSAEHYYHEQICIVCEDTGNDITVVCQGPCMQLFHGRCLGLVEAPPSYLCSECSSGKHRCFVCQNDDGEVKKCSINNCGKYYHQTCLNGVSLSTSSETRIVCSLHTCLTCFIENPKSVFCREGKMVKCARCPAAYHSEVSCVAAGSISLTENYILCAKHFVPQKNNKSHSRVSAPWCFICSEGGKNLVCCDTCPAAFHRDCLSIVPLEENYRCNDCANDKRPCYGDIVWAKLSSFRWWPAEVQHLKSVPVDVQKSAHGVGEFPIRFFGSHDYCWTHIGRVFSFQEGDKCSKEASSARSLTKVFKRAFEEATEAFSKWAMTKMDQEDV